LALHRQRQRRVLILVLKRCAMSRSKRAKRQPFPQRRCPNTSRNALRRLPTNQKPIFLKRAFTTQLLKRRQRARRGSPHRLRAQNIWKPQQMRQTESRSFREREKQRVAHLLSRSNQAPKISQAQCTTRL